MKKINAIDRIEALQIPGGVVSDPISAVSLCSAFAFGYMLARSYLKKYPSQEVPVDPDKIASSWDLGFRAGVEPKRIVKIDYTSQLYALGYAQGYKEVMGEQVGAAI